MAEPFDDTAKVFYRKLFQGWGLTVETETGVFDRSRSIGLVVDCDVEDLEERYYPLLPLARGKKLAEFVRVCLEEGQMDYLQMALDVGLVSDPMEVGRRVLEIMEMQPVTTDEMYKVFEEAFQKWPDLMWKFPSIRRALEAEARAEEQVRAAEARAAEARAEEQTRLAEEQTRLAKERGHFIGLGEGEQHGEVKARQEDLLRLMGRKFGVLPQDVASRVESTTDVEAPKRWLDRLLDVSSLAEMELGLEE